jgi:hypothetical protein
MDRVFNLNCQRMYATVLILVVVPVIVILLLITLILLFAPDIPDWLLISLILLGIGGSTLLVLKLIKEFNAVPAIITLNDWGIKIELEKRSIFFPRNVYTSPWTNIRAFSSTYSDQKQTCFYKVGFNDPNIDIYIDDTETVQDSILETDFSTYVLERINEVNKHSLPSTKIDTKNFYQSNWARNLTYLVWVVLVVLVVLGVFYKEIIEWWRIVQFASFSAVWLVAYYANNRKKSN